MIDLRSDTVTKPSAEMREAIAEAVVGDDVYHDDPTVNELEKTVARLLGKEDAVYVPTGTMSNQIALRTQTEPGDTVALHHESHIVRHELGGAAHNSGVTLAPLGGPYGTFTPGQLQGLLPRLDVGLPAHLFDPVTLVCLENTHNDSGGTIWDPALMRSVITTAKDLGIRTHLDGARLWNAAAASDTPLADLAEGFDTVSVCFSKGLGAPVGSALVGSAVTISRARRFKQMFGGGIRQGGVLAAAALFALENNRSRLTVDHANASAFANTVNESPSINVDLESVQTNLVYFKTNNADELVEACLGADIAMLALEPTLIRAVFHLDISPDEARQAAETVLQLSMKA